jgi:hypothetical protein
MSKLAVIVSAALDAGSTLLLLELRSGALAREEQGGWLWLPRNRRRRLADDGARQDLTRTVFKKSVTLTNDDPSRSTDQKASLTGGEK